jgi:hypothetical protein
LHGPVVTLKNEAQSQNGFAFIEAARRFFELQVQDIQSVAMEPSDGEVETIEVEEVSEETP